MNLIGSLKTIIKEERDANYLKWKRKNVTLRGIKDLGGEDGAENGGGAMLGAGLYTAYLSNKSMAKTYGKVYFVVNAIPKNPKVFNDLNLCEIWIQGNLIKPYCEKHGMGYNSNYFHENTTIPAEMMKLGYDGIVIKGREMVNYNPSDDVRYFEDEWRLENYYDYVRRNITEGEEHNQKPDIVYHGADCGNLEDLLVDFKILSAEEKMNWPSTGGGNFGLSTTIDPNIAKKYSQTFGCGKILSIKVNPNANFMFIDTNGLGVDNFYTYNDMEELANKGYDAIMETDEDAEKEVRILSPKYFKAISLI